MDREPPKDMQSRKSGSTTLKQCGWCEYAMGTHCFSYCIEGKCKLQTYCSPEVKWHTECTLIAAAAGDIQHYINGHNYEIVDWRAAISRAEGFIKVLEKIQKAASPKPVLPGNRNCDHFDIDRPIVVWLEGKWRFGEVKPGYRHHDGCVSYRVDGAGPQDEGFWGSGYAVPGVMLKTEWDYFKDNPGDYTAWCDVAYAKKYNGDTLEVKPIL